MLHKTEEGLIYTSYWCIMWRNSLWAISEEPYQIDWRMMHWQIGMQKKKGPIPWSFSLTKVVLNIDNCCPTGAHHPPIQHGESCAWHLGQLSPLPLKATIPHTARWRVGKLGKLRPYYLLLSSPQQGGIKASKWDDPYYQDPTWSHIAHYHPCPTQPSLFNWTTWLVPPRRKRKCLIKSWMNWLESLDWFWKILWSLWTSISLPF